jgi:hypothetical protein
MEYRSTRPQLNRLPKVLQRCLRLAKRGLGQS